METNPADLLIERELDLLNKEIESLRTGVSYIEKAANLVKLCEASVTSLQVDTGNSLRTLEHTAQIVATGADSTKNIIEKLQTLVDALRGTAINQTLEQHDHKLTSIQTLQGEIITKVQQSIIHYEDCLAKCHQDLHSQVTDNRSEAKRDAADLAELVATKTDSIEVHIAEKHENIIAKLLNNHLAITEESKHSRTLIQLLTSRIELLEEKLMNKAKMITLLLTGIGIVSTASLIVILISRKG